MVGFSMIILPKISLVVIYLTIIYLDMVNWTIINLFMVIFSEIFWIFDRFSHY
jgi:hypothetical protein